MKHWKHHSAFNLISFVYAIFIPQKCLYLVRDNGALSFIVSNGEKKIIDKKEMSYVRISNETSHHLRCVSVCVRMWKLFDYGYLQWTTTSMMMTYVNALKSKCVFGGRPGSRTITKNTTRKFRTAIYKHLHSPILSRSLALYTSSN